jgi:hypothetical protein
MKVFESKIRSSINQGKTPDIQDIKLLLKEMDAMKIEIHKLKRNKMRY